VAVVAPLLVVGAGVTGFVLGDIRAARALTVQRATPRQLAEAMKGDHFFSDYGRSSLIVTGTVSGVSRRDGDIVVAFTSGSSYGASCDLGTASLAPRVGESLTVVAPGGAAERLPAGVILRDGIVP
jgi:hypothetical protein